MPNLLETQWKDHRARLFLIGGTVGTAFCGICAYVTGSLDGLRNVLNFNTPLQPTKTPTEQVEQNLSETLVAIQATQTALAILIPTLPIAATATLPKTTDLPTPSSAPTEEPTLPPATTTATFTLVPTLEPTQTPIATRTRTRRPESTRTPSAPHIDLTKENGVLTVSQDGLVYLDSLKQNGYPVDQWNQYGEDGTFNGVEVTAGDNRQNSIKMDLWKADLDSGLWGNSEIATIVHRGESIALTNGFHGTGWVYPTDTNGNGWKSTLVCYDTIASLGRRIQAGENIGRVTYVRVPETNQHAVVRDDGTVIWQGIGDTRDETMVGAQGFVPLRALIALGLASYRRPPQSSLQDLRILTRQDSQRGWNENVRLF